MGLTCRTVSGLRLIRPKSTPSAEITSYKPTPVPISALVVSSLGIINTLVMAILNRRRKIGVLKALGAAKLLVTQGHHGIHPHRALRGNVICDQGHNKETN